MTPTPVYPPFVKPSVADRCFAGFQWYRKMRGGTWYYCRPWWYHDCPWFATCLWRQSVAPIEEVLRVEAW